MSRVLAPNGPEQGLTLLELAVTVAIIGVLTALLLPTLRAARERARTSACAGNLSTLYRGVAAYRNDFNEYYPTTRTPRGRDDPECRYWWGGYRRVGTMPWPVERELGAIHGYLDGLDEVLTCSSAHRLSPMYWLQSHASHYGYNGCWSSINLGAEALSAVLRPSNTVMYADSGCSCRQVGLAESPLVYPKTHIHFRHSGRANVLWCDGHVDAQSGFLRSRSLKLGGLPPPARFRPK